jgi:hypothetical protein
VVLVAALFVWSAFSLGQSPHAQSAHTFENQYVKMKVLPGWTVDTSAPALIKVVHGKYVLTIDPVLLHATAYGSLETIATWLPSVQAVMSGVEGPWSTSCAQPVDMTETAKITLFPLYTDATKENIDRGCTFPADGKPAWFASCYLGEGKENEFIIVLDYDSNDVNALPKKGTPELNRVLSEASQMMDSLVMKAAGNRR